MSVPINPKTKGQEDNVVKESEPGPLEAPNFLWEGASEAQDQDNWPGVDHAYKLPFYILVVIAPSLRHCDEDYDP